jgi:hypothetical protein
MADYVLEFYQQDDYSNLPGYLEDLDNLSGWASELCVEF